MGCWCSRLDREAMVSRCKARTRYMKQLVKSRHAFAAAHSLYLRSLRNTGSALLSFASAETTVSSTPPFSSSDRNFETTVTSSSAIFPDPSPRNSVSSVEDEVSSENTSLSDMEAAEADDEAEQPGNSELASSKGKDMVEIIQELDDYFVKAANAGAALSSQLEVPVCDSNRQNSPGKDYAYGKNSDLLLWSWSPFGKFCEDPSQNEANSVAADGIPTHHSTVEKLYTLEKKLYQEVKNAENLKLEHEKKAVIQKNLEMKGADHIKIEKTKKEVEKLESQVMVSLQTIEALSLEIIKLRESELYPQLLSLVMVLMNMWKSMYEFHQVQMHVAQQLKHLNCIPSAESTSESHRQSTLQLEIEAQQWLLSLTNLIKTQRDYIESLTGWLRLSLFQVGNNQVNKTKLDSAIYSFCEEWQHAINDAPDNVASEGIKNFLQVIRAIVVQQAEEQKQKRRAEWAFKEFEKKEDELWSLEDKHSQSSMSEAGLSKKNKDVVLQDRRAKVETLRTKAEEEKAKYEKAINVTRTMTINNLETGLPDVFQAMTGFADVCAGAFEAVYNQAKSMDDLKLILP